MSFIQAVPADLPEITRILSGILGTEGCTWTESYPTPEIIAGDIERGEMFLLKQNGEILAFSYVGIDEDAEYNALYLKSVLKRPCDIARIGVRRDLQGKGVGKLFFQHILSYAKARGFDGMRLLVSPKNPSATALYYHFGFKKIDECHYYDVFWHVLELLF